MAIKISHEDLHRIKNEQQITKLVEDNLDKIQPTQEQKQQQEEPQILPQNTLDLVGLNKFLHTIELALQDSFIIGGKQYQRKFLKAKQWRDILLLQQEIEKSVGNVSKVIELQQDLKLKALQYYLGMNPEEAEDAFEEGSDIIEACIFMSQSGLANDKSGLVRIYNYTKNLLSEYLNINKELVTTCSVCSKDIATMKIPETVVTELTEMLKSSEIVCNNCFKTLKEKKKEEN